jgi:hypothetical protein
MDVIKLTDEQISMARQEVVKRFATNSVAGHFIPEQTIESTATTVCWNRFDFTRRIVMDRETLDLYEPYAQIKFTKAQSEEKDLVRAKTTLNRQASALARWHDVLVFSGFNQDLQRRFQQLGVEMPTLEPTRTPRSFRDSAILAEGEAEREVERQPVRVNEPLNEGLVGACYDAVLRLEANGYYSAYHLVLGQDLWRALHEPTSGSMVLPRDRIQETLMGGDFHRTTTLPSNEALLISLDGPTLDCVVARDDPKDYPIFEFLRAEQENQEEIYLLRVRERFAPRVRERQAIVRLLIS